LQIILDENIKRVERPGKQNRATFTKIDAFPLEKLDLVSDQKTSLVVLEDEGRTQSNFNVFIGSKSDIAALYDPTNCKKMNDKCVICPDGKIRCTMVPLTK